MKTIRTFIFSTILFAASANAGFLGGSSLSMNVEGVESPPPPDWYLSPDNLFDLDPYWRNYDVPVSKRAAVFSHISDRLNYTKNVCPELEIMIDLNLKDASAQEVLDHIEKAIGSKIPRKVNVRPDITFTLKASEYRAYELIESMCIDAGLKLVFGSKRITITEQK